jgi:hypothetical protein
MSGEQAVTVMRKSALSMSRRVHELEQERAELQREISSRDEDRARLSARAHSAEDSLSKSQVTPPPALVISRVLMYTADVGAGDVSGG